MPDLDEIVTNTELTLHIYGFKLPNIGEKKGGNNFKTVETLNQKIMQFKILHLHIKIILVTITLFISFIT